tara:strand:- start:29695 stop:29937 length:243 start_codon:yes stop_codon:yes gene_type:complete
MGEIKILVSIDEVSRASLKENVGEISKDTSVEPEVGWLSATKGGKVSLGPPGGKPSRAQVIEMRLIDRISAISHRILFIY